MNIKICELDVLDTAGKSITLSMFEGKDLKKCMKMQMSWTTKFIQQLEHLKEQNPDLSTDELLEQGLFEDCHWQWQNKCMALPDEHYIWFTLENSDNEVETAVIIKHPQGSRFDKAAIYYIDYLAIAPWNRDSTLEKRRFKGLGPLMMKEVGKYLNVKLKYREGFSLHSLPQASSFYKKIGMDDFGPDADKQDLNYFEMQQANAIGFLRG